MMSSMPNYQELEELLLKLGYHRTPSTGSQKVYENPAYDAITILPDLPESQAVRPHHLLSIRRIAEEKGIVEAGDFDRLLTEIHTRRQDATANMTAA